MVREIVPYSLPDPFMKFIIAGKDFETLGSTYFVVVVSGGGGRVVGGLGAALLVSCAKSFMK